jgi:hypothetical protein
MWHSVVAFKFHPSTRRSEAGSFDGQSFSALSKATQPRGIPDRFRGDLTMKRLHVAQRQIPELPCRFNGISCGRFHESADRWPSNRRRAMAFRAARSHRQNCRTPHEAMRRKRPRVQCCGGDIATPVTDCADDWAVNVVELREDLFFATAVHRGMTPMCVTNGYVVWRR